MSWARQRAATREQRSRGGETLEAEPRATRAAQCECAAINTYVMPNTGVKPRRVVEAKDWQDFSARLLP